MQRDQLSSTFAALADPTRRAILARLASRHATVGELAEPFDMTLPSVSRHLKVLETAELIVREKDAQWRICQLRPKRLNEAADWFSHYQAFWNEQLDSLSDYVDELNSRKGD